MVTNNKDPQSPNTAITHYYQCSVAEQREVALAQLLKVRTEIHVHTFMHMCITIMLILMVIQSCMEEPCFDTLRTKKQLGYVYLPYLEIYIIYVIHVYRYTVYMTMHDTHNVIGLSVNLVTQGTKFRLVASYNVRLLVSVTRPLCSLIPVMNMSVLV